MDAEINEINAREVNFKVGHNKLSTMTKAEKKLWYEYLRGFHYRVHRQRPINNFSN
jgi:hypothetical protein